MTDGKPDFLTVRELAAYLRIKQRKVYALAASGEIPCSRATGKLLFPRESVEAWVKQHSSGGTAAGAGVEPATVFAGSHDPLLDWALRESRAGIATFFDGSLDGLKRLGEGQAMAGGMHLYEPATEGWNVGHLAAALPDAPLVLLEWAWRERGLIVAPDNPKAIRALADLRGLRFMPRQAEAGSQVLFAALCDAAELAPGAIDCMDPPARSEADVALAVADGKADAGFGLAGVARQFRLGFVPLMRERFDIAVFRRAYFTDAVQRFVAFCLTPAFAAKAKELGGYDITGFGKVHYNGP